MDTKKVAALADMIKESNNIVFFGGAGVSTESGIKDYRSPDGIYNTVSEFGVSPEEILSRSFFEEHPDVFYDFYRKYFISSAKPNGAHNALARLEELGKLKAVITQNIDQLHQMAGSKNVYELHGTTHKYYCHSCRRTVASVLDEIIGGGVPKCKHCGGIIRPDVILYEERLHDEVVDAAIDGIAKADMLIVGGTSLVVYPAASFVSYFKGKHFVIINKSATKFDERADMVIRDSIAGVFDEVMKQF